MELDNVREIATNYLIEKYGKKLTITSETKHKGNALETPEERIAFWDNITEEDCHVTFKHPLTSLLDMQIEHLLHRIHQSVDYRRYQTELYALLLSKNIIK